MKKLKDFEEHSNQQSELNLEEKLKKYNLDLSDSNPLLKYKGRLTVQEKKEPKCEEKNEQRDENQLGNFKTIKLSDKSLSSPENNGLTNLFYNEKTINNEDYLAIKNYTSLQYYIYNSFSSFDSLGKLKIAQSAINEKMLKKLEEPFNNNLAKALQHSINLEVIKKSKKKLLIMEIEGVIIHSSKKKIENFDSSFIIWDKGEKKIYVSKRPYLCEFLDDVSKYFIICFYTSISESILSELKSCIFEGRNDLIEGILDNRFLFDSPSFGKIKFLDIFKNYKSFSDIIFIDNNFNSFPCNLQNGFVIKKYKGDPNDSELPKLAKFLDEIIKTENIPKYLSFLRNCKK